MIVRLNHPPCRRARREFLNYAISGNNPTFLVGGGWYVVVRRVKVLYLCGCGEVKLPNSEVSINTLTECAITHLPPGHGPVSTAPDMKRFFRNKAAQPRSSEKNAASRAGQTPCTRWAVGICYTRAKSVCNGCESCLRREAALSFFTKSREFMGSWWSETSGGANLELEAAVARGKSKYGDVTVTGQGVRTRKTNCRCPQVELSTPL